MLMSADGVRYVATIADGNTDHDVIYEITRCTISGTRLTEHIRLLGKKAHPFVEEFFRQLDDETAAFKLNSALERLKSRLVALIEKADGSLQNRVDLAHPIRPSDVLVLSTDSERRLPVSKAYFRIPSVFLLPRIFTTAVRNPITFSRNEIVR